MIADATFSQFVPQAVTSHLRSVGDEFTVSEQKKNVTEQLARKYSRALASYEKALGECPYSGLMIEPSAHDVMMSQKLSEELKRVRSEYSRILAQCGGTLSLAHNEDE